MTDAQRAISLAKELRAAHFTDAKSVRDAIWSICDAHGISIDYSPYNSGITTLPDGTHIITLPQNTSQARDNFLAADGIGQILLRHDEGKKTFSALFAAELLMPKGEFTQAALKCNKDRDKLAAKFQISPCAALVRMVALGLTK